MTEQKLFKRTCKKCGHSWIPRKKKSYTCPNPKCRTPKWDVDPDENNRRL